MVRLLIRRKGDASARNKKGDTALDLAKDGATKEALLPSQSDGAEDAAGAAAASLREAGEGAGPLGERTLGGEGTEDVVEQPARPGPGLGLAQGKERQRVRRREGEAEEEGETWEPAPHPGKKQRQHAAPALNYDEDE
jgi:hypothetical protein